MIIFYEVQNCVCENYQNTQPVLLAPQGYDPAVLARNGFVALPDGRWAHFLTEQEYMYMTSVPQGQDVRFYAGMFGQPAQSASLQGQNMQGFPMPDTQTPEQIQKDAKIANVLAGISAACLALTFVIGGAQAKDLTALGAILFQVGLVLMIIVRVRYKNNLFGKILMWIYIVLCALAIIGVLLLIAVCGSILRDCNIN